MDSNWRYSPEHIKNQLACFHIPSLSFTNLEYCMGAMFEGRGVLFCVCRRGNINTATVVGHGTPAVWKLTPS